MPAPTPTTTLPELQAERARLTGVLEILRARVERNDVGVTDADISDTIDQRRRVDADIAERSGPVGYERQARVGEEPRTYTRATADGRDGRECRSLFSDFYRSEYAGDFAARDRLTRHATEVGVEREGLTERATTTGSYAGLVVPQYLVDLAANVLRSGRPMANACTRLPIPTAGMSFILPKASTGVTATSQATENTAASNTDQVWGNVTVPVASIMGQQQVSRQSLERGTPGIDSLIYMDLAAAYSAELDRQIFVGTGASGQVLGINGTGSIYTATLFGAAATPTTFFSKLAGAIAGIAGAGTAIRAGYIVMHPRRWGWLTLAVDTTGRPLIDATGGPFNAYGLNASPAAYGGDAINGEGLSEGPIVVGTIQGLPVITDSSVPTNLGGGTTEDVVFVFDPNQALLFEEGDGAPRQLKFEQIQVSGVVGFGATVTLAVYNYVAFSAARYPQAFGRVGGVDATGVNGLQAPTY